MRQIWVFMKVVNDSLPLLAHICSLDCMEMLPKEKTKRSRKDGKH